MSNFLELRKAQMKIKSAGDYLRNDGVAPINNPELLVNGGYLDNNIRKWQKGDGIGIIGSSGIGKTSFILWIFKQILLNNPEGICVFVACEMTNGQLLAKWQKATQDTPHISDRFYIITSHDDDGNARDLSIRGIKRLLLEHKTTLNQEILSYVIDHLHIVRREDNESLDSVVYYFSNMNKELNSVGILSAQTTKGKSSGGDIPLDKDACYGCSAYTWELSYIYTLCQPLIRLQDQVDLPVTGWNLAKNRFKEKQDNFKEGTNYLLKFNYYDESYTPLNQSELTQFTDYYSEVIELREAEDKKKQFLFDTSYRIKSKTGKEVKINRKAGRREDSSWE
jgi:archaellum biogenesis ATPase FlaH